MSNFNCEKCKKTIIDTPSSGYITGCEHFPIEPKYHQGTIKPLDGEKTISNTRPCHNDIYINVQKIFSHICPVCSAAVYKHECIQPEPKSPQEQHQESYLDGRRAGIDSAINSIKSVESDNGCYCKDCLIERLKRLIN